ncbi:peptidyl-prolyl cis-trans isomerase-like 3 [Monocercomonoides exilis]|uniref:peptidyl-prolyl cis-trans isomerase-like 3 n=1 Tax=Monocercomonoides exilis TaxID=2049356 RepID=UPI003559F98F|nr:peptidyl-prolyl cis-trans isomerase-like 3 [Monocercomonoides exilis]|eukprot:MONOS_13503.1-p1 / transcript=MONOS_13503.1 / gene=MONOS_13503 / organism=Monocercomonoides_exilis_PA203 / gene_product=peptidyl-prolyl cis-trans isomerase-like 3 / transcript_product=peptidyl-prolyl cis-trans isomerase-like 3 / location=Mono_scaffold00837:13287-14001(+) / protein_length=116 / sequence_SO=supercontig / SO=protein_coding / is_pseudo=false
MIQGGDPTGTGRGGTSIWGTKFEEEYSDLLTHSGRGIVSMANMGKPGTNASQFFITYSKQTHLDDKYTIFGKVIDGFDTLDAMEKTPTDENSRPIHEIKIISVTIHANPIAEVAL